MGTHLWMKLTGKCARPNGGERKPLGVRMKRQRRAEKNLKGRCKKRSARQAGSSQHKRRKRRKGRTLTVNARLAWQSGKKSWTEGRRKRRNARMRTRQSG